MRKRNIAIIWSKRQREAGWPGEIPFYNLCPKGPRCPLTWPQCLSPQLLVLTADQSHAAQRDSPELPGRSQHSRGPAAAAGSWQGWKGWGLWGGPGQWGSEQRTSLGKRYHLVIPHLPFPAVGPALLTSKHQQRAQQGKFHGPRTEQWKQLLEVKSGYLPPPPSRAHPRPSQLWLWCMLFLFPLSGHGEYYFYF